MKPKRRPKRRSGFLPQKHREPHPDIIPMHEALRRIRKERRQKESS